MSGVEFGLLMFGAMLVLLALRVPIGIAMLAIGMAGYVAAKRRIFAGADA